MISVRSLRSCKLFKLFAKFFEEIVAFDALRGGMLLILFFLHELRLQRRQFIQRRRKSDKRLRIALGIKRFLAILKRLHLPLKLNKQLLKQALRILRESTFAPRRFRHGQSWDDGVLRENSVARNFV